MRFLLPLLLVLCASVFSILPAQTIGLSYQTPDGLLVCGTDTVQLTVQNNTPAALPGVEVTLTLPAGLEYVAGSVAGAAEVNIGNLGQPVLALTAALAPGASAAVSVQIRATCALVDAINANELFSITIAARQGTLVNSVATTNFIVETPFVVITQIDGDSLSGQIEDVLTRTIYVRNTRLGALSELTLRDVHNAGMTVSMPGALAQATSPTAHTATFGGSFFTGFGDGDALFEYNEVLVIVEQLTITDCGETPFFIESTITAEWRCAAGQSACQADEDYAEVYVQTSTKVPAVAFYPTYGLPWNYCGEEKSEMKVLMINEGTRAAENVVLALRSVEPNYLGMHPGSFRLRSGGVESPVGVSVVASGAIDSCQQSGVSFASQVSYILPYLAPGDTVELVFDAYFCASRCDGPLPVIAMDYFYTKPCPPSLPFDNGTKFFAGTADNLWIGLLRYGIGSCLQDGQVYDFSYELQSRRLMTDTGFVWFTLDMPWGVFWEDCGPLLLDGHAPAYFNFDTLVTFDTIVRMLVAFPLPISVDSVGLEFCLRATCADDASFVSVPGNSLISGTNFQQIVPPCSNCGYPLEAEILLTRSPLPTDFECAVSACSKSTLRTNCPCPLDGGGGEAGVVIPPGNGSGCFQLEHDLRAERKNVGLVDANDDRMADGTGPANSAGVRRDRFMPGDTLEAVATTRILCGDSIAFLPYQFFIETTDSDMSYAGVNDVYDLQFARSLLTNADRFRVIETEVVIWDSSSNAVYTCTADLELHTDSLFGTLTLVNSQPPQIYDRVISMSHVVTVNLNTMAGLGCVPFGFTMEAGDSMEVRVRYKLDFNCAPFSPQNWPALINFEVGLKALGYPPAFYNYRVHDTIMLQYSGYRDTLTDNVHGIRPCDLSNEVRPFFYGIRLARPNLFPFEVRPLTRIDEYSLQLPDEPIMVDTAVLQYLKLQDNVPVYTNEPLNYGVVGNRVNFDFSPFYATPLDEGYQLLTGVVFDSSCLFTRPDTSIQRAVIDYYNCLRMPARDTVMLGNALGYLAIRARDTLTTNELLLEFPTAAVSFDVQLKNLSPIGAPNYWIRFDNPEGGLTGYSMVQLPGNTPLAELNGIFQLPNVGGFSTKDLRVFATNTTCDSQTLRIIYGWNCTPYSDTAMMACEDDTLTMLILPQLPELELNPVQFPTEIPLCDSSEYIVVELSNADIGYAYTPYFDFELPAGVQYVPGSFGLSYPAGAPFAALPDPAVLAPNQWGWALTDVVPAIDTGGLPGVNLEPLNAVRVRFRVLSACGAVSNQQIVFGTGGKNSCGENTNLVRKASPPLLIEGLAPGYAVQLSVSGATTPMGCDEERELTFTALLGGTPLGGDSLYVALPAGFSYVGGSYVPGANAPAGPPTVSGSQLQLALPGGLAPNTAVTFTLRVRTPQAPLCDGATMTVQTRQRTVEFCPLTGTDCTVYVATGETTFSFAPAAAALTVNSAGVSLATNGTVSVSADFTNTGTVSVALSTVQWYRDVDGSGTLTAADTLVFTLPVSQTIGPGGLGTLLQGGLPNPGNLCGLLLVVPTSGNCLCAPAVLPLPASLQTSTALQACEDVPITVGVVGMPGFTYSWSPAAPCAACPAFEIIPAEPGTSAFTLTEQGAGCTIVHQFTLTQFANPLFLGADTVICRGQTVTLPTTGGTAWQWSPPGPGAPGPTLTVQPAVTTTYAVTITSAEACTTEAAATVTVRDSSLLNLGVVSTCPGEPVDVFGTPTDVPGTYCQTLVKANGCDSTVCVVVEVYPDVVLPFFDSTLVITAGDSVILPGPPGFATYNWAPPTDLSCTDCQNPLATPADTTIYTLTVTTADGCVDSLRYRILVLPPCDAARVEMPNAFTPNGDGHNDVFRPVLKDVSPANMRLTIWDRWGEKVYENTGVGLFWDGTYKGKTVPQDVYLWILDVDCFGEIKQRRGDVTVLR